MPNPFDQFDDAKPGSIATPAAAPPANSQAAPSSSDTGGQSSQPQQAASSPGNTFDQFDDTPPTSPPAGPSPIQQQQMVAAQQKAESTGAFMTGVQNFNRQFGRMAEGSLKVGAYISKALGGGDTELAILDRVTREQDRIAAQSAKDHPGAAIVGNTLGAAARSIPLAMTTGGGGLVSQAAKVGLGNAGMTASENTPDLSTEDKLKAAGESGLIGAAAVPAVAGIVGGAKLLNTGVIKPAGAFIKKMVRPADAAVSDVADDIVGSGTPAAAATSLREKAAAANQIGAPLTPAQIIQSPSTTADEARTLVVDPAARAKVSMVNQATDGILRKGFMKSVDDMVPEGAPNATATKDALYQKMAPTTIAVDDLNAINNNPAIRNRIVQFNKNSDVPADIRVLPQNSIGYLNAVKTSLDKELYRNVTATGGVERPMTNIERRALTEARTQLYDAMAKASPNDYPAASAIAERLSLQKMILKDISKIPVAAGAPVDPQLSSMMGHEVKAPPLTKVYDKLWKTPEQQNNFLEMVERTGGDKDNAKAIIDVIGQVKAVPLTKLLTKEIGVPDTAVSGRTVGIVKKFVGNVMHGQYNKQLINLITSGKEWQDKVNATLVKYGKPGFFSSLKNLLLQMNNAKTRAMPGANLLSRAVGQVAGQAMGSQSQSTPPTAPQ